MERIWNWPFEGRVTDNVVPFNPLDKKNLGAPVAEALLTSSVRPLSDVPSFFGAGIYVLYYTGTYPAYEALATRNQQGKFLAPIYIGKAIPPGRRKGLSLETRSRVLSSRLKEHAESVQAVSNLNVEDFFCRLLVVDDIWIPLGESLLIGRYRPLWNSIVDGFGNHDSGKGRYQGMCPKWDVLHPGRVWAARCQALTKASERIALAVQILGYAPGDSYNEIGLSKAFTFDSCSVNHYRLAAQWLFSTKCHTTLLLV
jgi:Eco29kI restriction endonuclease